MNLSDDDRKTFTAALQVARRRCAEEPSSSVLDLLEKEALWSAIELDALLSKCGGVEVVRAEDDASGADLTAFGDRGALVARQWRAVPLRRTGAQGPLRIAMADPWHDGLLRSVSQAVGGRGQHIMPVAAPQKLLDHWLGKGNTNAPASPSGPAAGGMPGSGEASGPVVDFVDGALRRAYTLGASDIHFECGRHGVQVRFRRDGVLVPHARLDDIRRAEEAISRIKVLAQLDITERRLPQDGRFRLSLPGGEIDLRVSIIPSVFGEDAVLRLLDKAQLRDPAEQVSLDRLGFDSISAEQIRELAELPHGMLLVTGPTGSGKTTTVYAALSEVNNGLEKIITIEDPVEYELQGVLQVPVNERKGLTFAKGLRSILRHDPDRILVGEIRDAETAEIAVQSALTGHQVLTTVHANSVFDVTGRFKHFGLDMFGFMAALNGVIVQRLVRCLCPACSSLRPATQREADWLRDIAGVEAAQVPLAVGCDACGGTGFKGRRVIAEVHSMDDGFRDLVTTGAPVSALREHVYRRGVKTLSSLGADMVMRRQTSAEEIKRVVGW